MRSSLRALGAGALLSAMTVLGASAADHRDAPVITEFPPADINDVYVFRAPGARSRLVLAMTVNPVADPEFAPGDAFSPHVLYRFAIDNTGDAVPEHTIDVTFTPLAAGRQRVTATFSEGGIAVTGSTTRPSLGDTPNAPVVIEDPAGGGIRLFAGPRDDPFYFDLVGFNRFVAGVDDGETNPDEFRGVDSFRGLNVSAIVIEFPVALVRDGATELQIYGLTLGRTAQGPGRILDRMGNPVVNTVFIPSGQKNAFNRSLPENDADNYADEILDRLGDFGTSQDSVNTLAAVAVPDTLKLDLQRGDGYPNGRRLRDDVIDTLFALILDNPDAGDGVDRNDRTFSNSFPYLAPPHQAP